MTEDEINRIAELHLDDADELAELRDDPRAAAVLAALDLVVWELESLRDTAYDMW